MSAKSELGSAFVCVCVYMRVCVCVCVRGEVREAGDKQQGYT